MVAFVVLFINALFLFLSRPHCLFLKLAQKPEGLRFDLLLRFIMFEIVSYGHSNPVICWFLGNWRINLVKIVDGRQAQVIL
jgi:hypothetical protein